MTADEIKYAAFCYDECVKNGSSEKELMAAMAQCAEEIRLAEAERRKARREPPPMRFNTNDLLVAIGHAPEGYEPPIPDNGHFRYVRGERGCGRPRADYATRKKCYDLWTDGVRSAAISAFVGVPRSTVRCWINERFRKGEI